MRPDRRKVRFVVTLEVPAAMTNGRALAMLGQVLDVGHDASPRPSTTPPPTRSPSSGSSDRASSPRRPGTTNPRPEREATMPAPEKLKKSPPKSRRAQVVLSLSYPGDLDATRAIELFDMVLGAGIRAAATQGWVASRLKIGKPRMYRKPPA
jgi:hypothetical protein